nr:hypothetical protein [Tanacetum cinerariifolium]
MSDSEDSTVTYTSVSSPYEGRLGDVSPGEDGPPVMPKDPYAYVVAAFQALPPPDYVPGPEETEQAPPSPVYIPYVPEPEYPKYIPVEDEPVYPEYIPPEDDVFLTEEQPLPAAASPTAESPGYIPESDSNEDLEEGDDEDPADYPTDHDDDDEEEPSRDDADEEDDEADRPEVTLPPRKRLSIVHCPGYEAGESSVAAAARPIEGHRADYGFVDFVEAEIRRRRAEDIGYGIR